MLSSNFAVASSLLLSQVDMSPAPTRTAEPATVDPWKSVADGICERKITSEAIVNRRKNLFIFLLRRMWRIIAVNFLDSPCLAAYNLIYSGVVSALVE